MSANAALNSGFLLLSYCVGLSLAAVTAHARQVTGISHKRRALRLTGSRLVV
jgi:23S rRNA G2069 N7-methylase RlmK/C1962 C5-methylase RlmI